MKAGPELDSLIAIIAERKLETWTLDKFIRNRYQCMLDLEKCDQRNQDYLRFADDFFLAVAIRNTLAERNDNEQDKE